MISDAETAFGRVRAGAGPPEIASHPAVRLNAKRRSRNARKILLDSSIHHSAINVLSMAERRGRSDLVHIFLLVALESVLNRKGMLEVYVHTRNDKLITIDPKTRLPKNYPRFVGLMESLFEKGAVPSEESPLIILRSGYNISRCLLTIAHTKVVLLSNEGNRVNLNSYFKEREGDILCIIGGFSKGDFTGDLRSKPIDVISVFEDSLPVWTVASELIVNYERYLF